MKLIGIEEHFLTAEIRDAWNAIGLGATDPSVAFHSGTIEGRLRAQNTSSSSASTGATNSKSNSQRTKDRFASLPPSRPWRRARIHCSSPSTPNRSSNAKGSVANYSITRVVALASVVSRETLMFKGRHFDRSIILLCVRWYLACGLRTASGLVIWRAKRRRSRPRPKMPWRGRLDDRWLRDCCGESGRDWLATWSWIDRNLWTCRGDLNLFIIRSRRLVGR